MALGVFFLVVSFLPPSASLMFFALVFLTLAVATLWLLVEA